MASATFHLILNNLSTDAKTVGVNYAHEQLQGVTPEQLRALLQAFGAAAAKLTIYEPAVPEIRIKTERSAFVVRARHRRLCLMGWETKLRGADHSVSLILNTINGVAPDPVTGAIGPGVAERGGSNPPTGIGTGSRAPFGGAGTASNPPFGTGSRAPFGPGAGRKPEKESGLPRWAKIAGLGALILAFNATTVWLVFFRPPPSPVPDSQPVPDFETTAMLSKAAGEYETGGAEGDRRLIIESGGNVRLAKYGPERAVLQETTRTAKGGIVNGRAMLVTSDPATIEIKDADTVIYFKTTYRRRNR